MTAAASTLTDRSVVRQNVATTEPAWVRWSLISAAMAVLGLFLVLPLIAVFTEALSQGWSVYLQAIVDADTRSAVRLTIIASLISVPLNAIFGIAAAWLLARFEFRGRGLLQTLIDLPLAVSPVIAGMLFILLFGTQGLFGGWLDRHDLHIVFAIPGIVLATTFITLPMVARELIPLLREQGPDEELAALVLGASGWQIFRRVTLPNLRWGLLYGIILCNARAMGEFGAVSVVSGHIRGQTNTVPLHVEILYNEYHFAAAFAVASLLTLLALVTLIVKSLIEWRASREQLLATDAVLPAAEPVE
jgi:sulfate transport system permease protein